MKPIFSRNPATAQPKKINYIMLCFALLVLVLSFMVYTFSKVDPRNFQGNLAAAALPEVATSTPTISETPTASEEASYLKLFQSLYADLPGAEAFLADAATWKEVDEVKIDKTDSGIFVSVSATTTGDSLHPYFGFFRKEKGDVVEVIWSGVTTGTLEATPENSSEKYMAAAIVNTGKFPWLPGDSWKNDSNDEDLVLVANNDAEAVLPGESGTFVYRSTNEKILPHNMTRGFLINIKATKAE